MLPVAGREEYGELVFNGCRISVGKDEKVLEINGDDGCIIM